MSRLKMRLLYLGLISVLVFMLLIFLMPANNTPNYLNFHKQKAWRNITSSGRLSLLFVSEAEKVKTNGTEGSDFPRKEVKTVSEAVEKEKKIEVDRDMLQRIEILLSEIKQKQDRQDGNSKGTKDIQHKMDKNNNDILKKTGANVIGKRSEEQKPKISPVLSGDKTSQENDNASNQDLLGSIKSSLDRIVAKEVVKEEIPKHSHEIPSDAKSLSVKTPSDANSSKPESCESCFKNDFKYLINPESVCKHSNDLDLLIAISSAPTDYKARSVIRKTWAAPSLMESGKMKCVFFVGNIEDQQMQQELRAESDRYNDIVQLQFKDSYANLTYKTLSELRWVSEYCKNAKYMMKTDGDMYVNTLILPNILKDAPKEKFIGGHCWGRSLPHREKSSKWYVSYKSYTHSSFPPMCSGTGYVISMDFVLQILQVSKSIPFFHLEDVFIALCAKKLNVQPVYIDGFYNIRPSFDDCTYRYRVVTSHQISPDLLQMYWDRVKMCSIKMDELHYQAKPLYIP